MNGKERIRSILLRRPGEVLGVVAGVLVPNPRSASAGVSVLLGLAHLAQLAAYLAF